MACTGHSKYKKNKFIKTEKSFLLQKFKKIMSKKKSLSLTNSLRNYLEYYLDIGIDRIDNKVKTILSATSPTMKTYGDLEIQINRSDNSDQSLLLTKPEILLNKDTSLEEISLDLVDCKRCRLCQGRSTIVFGSGNPRPSLVFIGEGPGKEEDQQGLPFVGRAGQLLTKMIQSIQLQRNDVYICNVVKCRPPENRIPSEDEVATCSPFLFRQLSVLRPKLICCLGLTATQTILKVKGSLGRLRNKIHTFQDIQVIATYHPAYLLRNPSAKKEAWEDLKKIRSMLNQ